MILDFPPPAHAGDDADKNPKPETPTPPAPPPSSPRGPQAMPYPDEEQEPYEYAPGKFTGPRKATTHAPVEAAQTVNQFREDVNLIGEIARRGIRYQFAFLALLEGYSAIFQATARALSHLQPQDFEADKQLKDKLMENALAVERALSAQQPSR